jgi:hypothetical protein
VTKPEKQDGTMELDVGQIDLLDLPLPPRSKPAVEAEEVRGSKGPPPLPPVPSAPPPAEEEPPVPSLALPNSSPSQPHPPAGAISARQLAFGPPPKQKSAVVQLMLGMGGATILCVLAFVGWKMTHKTQAVAPAPAASSATTPAPTHTFTMAPIEFTAGSALPEESAAPSAHAAPTTTTTTTSTTKPSSTAHGAPTSSSGKPPKTDELIKVEN